MPTARLVHLTGTLVDATGTPIPAATVQAALDADQTTTLAYVPDELSVVPRQIGTVTATDGTWSLGLVAPNDLSVPGLSYALTILDDALDRLYSADTGPFAYQSSPLPLATLLASPPPSAETLCTVWGYLVHPSGLPLEGVTVTLTPSQSAVSLTTGNVVDASTPITATSDPDGYWAVQVVPTTLLVPSSTQYAVAEGTGVPKFITCTTAGGNVNTLPGTARAAHLVPLTSGSVAADLTEASATLPLGAPPVPGSLVDTLDRLRAVLAAHSGGHWYDQAPMLTLNPATPQTGGAALTGTATAQSGLLTAADLHTQDATVTGNLTVGGTISAGNTIPTGSILLYTTPHGRQNFLGTNFL